MARPDESLVGMCLSFRLAKGEKQDTRHIETWNKPPTISYVCSGWYILRVLCYFMVDFYGTGVVLLRQY